MFSSLNDGSDGEEIEKRKSERRDEGEEEGVEGVIGQMEEERVSLQTHCELHENEKHAHTDVMHLLHETPDQVTKVSSALFYLLSSVSLHISCSLFFLHLLFCIALLFPFASRLLSFLHLNGPHHSSH